MSCGRGVRPGDGRRRIRVWSCWVITPGAIVCLPAGRIAVLLVAAGLALMLAVAAAVVLGAAFASRHGVRRAAARTLDQLLRLIPWSLPR